MKIGGGWNSIYKQEMKIILPDLLYSALIFFVVSFLNVKKIVTVEIGVRGIMESFFPMLFGNWFIVMYCLFLLTIPFVNFFLKRLDRKQFDLLIVFIFVFWSVIPTFTNQSWLNFGTGSFAVFYCSYPIGAWIRRFAIGNDIPRKKHLIRTILLGIIILLMVLVADCVAIFRHANHITGAYYFSEYNTIFAFLMAIELFQFARKSTWVNDTVNLLSGSVIGVMIIHTNNLIKGIIWQIVSPNILQLNTPHFVLHMFFKAMAVFAVCIGIDLLRRKVFGRIEKTLIKKLEMVWFKCCSLVYLIQERIIKEL